MTTLGARIRARRQELGLTATALAKRAGCSKGYLSELEHGKRGIGADILLALGQALGSSLDYLMLGSEAQPNNDAVFLLPRSLRDWAYHANVPFQHVMAVYWTGRVIIDTKHLDVEAFDWCKFYERVKEFL
jgi:transcriptional regulator with XRE-family HTH domain